LDSLPASTYFRVIIDNPVFEELVFGESEKSKRFEGGNGMTDIDGRVEFVGNGVVLACFAFSLIQGIESLYPMKTKDGHFCGLLKIKVL
jgi:hypothetical protein